MSERYRDDEYSLLSLDIQGLMPYETPAKPGSKIEFKECKLRQLPTIEQLEPAAREYCRLMGHDPESTKNMKNKTSWRIIAGQLKEELARRWALDVFERSVSVSANGETQ